MAIRITNINGKGFLSFYDRFHFYPGTYEGKTVQIDGDNQDDAFAESNGSGKSGLLEAISWGIYGQLCRKNKFSDEVIHKKGTQCEVDIVGDRNGEPFLIKRTRDRNGSTLRFILAGKEPYKGATQKLVQAAIEQFIGMNFVSFLCSTLFGQDFSSFPDLKAAERGQLLSEARGLTRYTEAAAKSAEKANKSVKKLNTVKEELIKLEERRERLEETDYTNEIELFEEERQEEIDAKLKNIDQTNERIAAVNNEREKEVKKANVELKKLDKRKEVLQKKLEPAKADQEDRDDYIANLATVRSERGRIEAEIRRWEKTPDFCPTCGKPMDKEDISLADKWQKDLIAKTKEVEIAIEALKEVDERLKVYEPLKVNLSSVGGMISATKRILTDQSYTRETGILKGKIQEINADIAAKKVETNPYTELEKKRLEGLNAVLETIKERESEAGEYEGKINLQEASRDLFKKLQLSLFDNMVTAFEDKAQELLSLYSSSLQVYFDTERETRSGTTKDEFHIIVEDETGPISYEMYSGGERQKVKLAVQLALAGMIQDHCGIDFKFAAFDEPNNGLDAPGKDANFQVFQDIARSGKAVLVADHDSFFTDKFDEVVTVVKKDGKSQII